MVALTPNLVARSVRSGMTADLALTVRTTMPPLNRGFVARSVRSGILHKVAMTFKPKSTLPRLSREFYQGQAFVLWTHTIEGRTTGWLNEEFHQRFREALLHACHRYELATPVYALMPDHFHVIGLGLQNSSDQWLATAFLRKHLTAHLGAHRLQDRAHDHVLRDSERTRGALEDACTYVFRNPERASLVSDWRNWPYVGSVVPGYPRLDVRKDDYWERFWKIYNRLAASHDDVPALTRRATTGGFTRGPRGPLREERETLP